MLNYFMTVLNSFIVAQTHVRNKLMKRMGALPGAVTTFNVPVVGTRPSVVQCQ